jgi:hypothetical protein
MSRRRKLLVAALVLAVLGAAWWWFATGMTAEERRLVGRWQRHDGDQHIVLAFLPDRRWEFDSSGSMGAFNLEGAWWYVRDGSVVYGDEPSRIRRVLRPVLLGLGFGVPAMSQRRLEWVTDDEFDMIGDSGDRVRWARVRGE